MSLEVHKRQLSIYKTLLSLELLPKVIIVRADREGSIETLSVRHPQQYVPDFVFEWCPGKEHYRVYIHIAHTTYDKRRAGYCIATVRTSLAAMAFAMMYSFLHKHRANNKDAATD